jgi:hypothetical protein
MAFLDKRGQGVILARLAGKDDIEVAIKKFDQWIWVSGFVRPKVRPKQFSNFLLVRSSPGYENLLLLVIAKSDVASRTSCDNNRVNPRMKCAQTNKGTQPISLATKTLLCSGKFCTKYKKSTHPSKRAGVIRR